MYSIPTLDDTVLQRYDKPGPRYTSYPTALQFRTDFGIEDLSRFAESGNAQTPARPISLYVHIPFCQSPCFYCGCNRSITRDRSKGEPYVERVLREAQLAAPLFARDRQVIQLHLGGGTPNFLRPQALERLISGLAEAFKFTATADRDFSIELDPRALPEEPARYAQRLAALGFNRISIGVQDFDPEVQRAVNRLQTIEQTLDLVDACRDSGFRSVNLDLIYGLPRQTPQGFYRTLRTVIAARPDRIALYGYAHLPALFKAQRRIATSELPDASTRLALLRLGIEQLDEFGYRYIGMDHFALPDDELVRALETGSLQRNFMGYTTHSGCDLVGLGVSAISHVGDSYSQNFRDLKDWEGRVDTGQLPLWRGLRLTPDDCTRASVIEQLMCRGRIDIRSLERAHDIDFKGYFEEALGLLQQQHADGLIELEEDSIRVTQLGRLLLRNIAMCFDAYLPRGKQATLMSQAV